MAASVTDRFNAFIRQDDDGCWIWMGHLDRHGYGRFRLGMRMTSAHRTAYELFVSAIPAGRHIDHLCRVPACVNPAHLEPVEPIENWWRGRAQSRLNVDRTHCVHGHPFDRQNTYVSPNGRRRACRACNLIAAQRYRKARA